MCVGADGMGICMCVCARAEGVCVCVCVCVLRARACVYVCVHVCVVGESGLVHVYGGGRDLITKVTNTSCTLISKMEKGKKKRIETNHIPSKSGTTVVNILVCGLFCCSPHFC